MTWSMLSVWMNSAYFSIVIASGSSILTWYLRLGISGLGGFSSELRKFPSEVNFA